LEIIIVTELMTETFESWNEDGLVAGYR